jgi:hypothetical protein
MLAAIGYTNRRAGDVAFVHAARAPVRRLPARPPRMIGGRTRGDADGRLARSAVGPDRNLDDRDGVFDTIG